jgi:hypothetical protein
MPRSSVATERTRGELDRPGYRVPLIALGLVVLVAACIVVAIARGKS